jgi:hypothetical protein
MGEWLGAYASSFRCWPRGWQKRNPCPKKLPLAGQNVNGWWPQAVTSLPLAALDVRARAGAIGAGVGQCAHWLLADSFAFTMSSHEIVANPIFSLGRHVGLVGQGGHDS